MEKDHFVLLLGVLLLLLLLFSPNIQVLPPPPKKNPCVGFPNILPPGGSHRIRSLRPSGIHVVGRAHPRSLLHLIITGLQCHLSRFGEEIRSCSLVLNNKKGGLEVRAWIRDVMLVLIYS